MKRTGTFKWWIETAREVTNVLVQGGEKESMQGEKRFHSKRFVLKRSRGAKDIRSIAKLADSLTVDAKAEGRQIRVRCGRSLTFEAVTSYSGDKI